jgi:hypothetical protein
MRCGPEMAQPPDREWNPPEQGMGAHFGGGEDPPQCARIQRSKGSNNGKHGKETNFRKQSRGDLRTAIPFRSVHGRKTGIYTSGRAAVPEALGRRT